MSRTNIGTPFFCLSWIYVSHRFGVSQCKWHNCSYWISNANRLEKYGEMRGKLQSENSKSSLDTTSFVLFCYRDFQHLSPNLQLWKGFLSQQLWMCFTGYCMFLQANSLLCFQRINVPGYWASNFIHIWQWEVPIPIPKSSQKWHSSDLKDVGYVCLFPFDLINISFLSESGKL